MSFFSPIRVTLRPALLLLLAGGLTACEVFKPATPARRPVAVTSRPGTRPATTTGTRTRPAPAKTNAGRTLKTVDSRTYQRTYVPEVVSVARTYTGTPYRTGGNTTAGIDCSGLVMAVFESVGLKLPRVSWQQSETGQEIETENIQPGDLLFFVPDKGKAGYVSHTAIVTEVRGKNDIQFIHASSSRGVREDNLFADYFRNRYVKAVRPF